MSKLRSTLILLSLLLAFPAIGRANNLSISNVRITDCDSTTRVAAIEFDISWDNSWRDSTNYDAVWVFLKGYITIGLISPDTVTYSHWNMATAGTNPSDTSTGSGTPIDIVVPNDKKGAFIQRRQLDSGSVSVTDVRLAWYAGTGWNCSLSFSAPAVNVYGIEMVYIPEGGFHAGDGNSGATNAEFEYGSSSSLPAPVNSENGISFSNVSADGWYYNSASNTVEYASGSVFNVSSSYPKGYQAFYIMKYELSQGQYVIFLNNLSRNQQRNRVQAAVSGNAVTNIFVMADVSAATSSNRSRITCPSTGNGSSSPITFSASSSVGAGRDNRAANWLSWMDLAAYADWAALRPMTELEYEKAARGPIYPVTSEYAWGTTSITQAATISGTENGAEYITTANANACYGGATFTGGDGDTGPLRCGIFATSATVTRQTSGAGYYGAMELSGNVAELVVSMGNSAGISFSGTHGDGTLTNISGATYDGNATNIDWPGIDTTDISRGVTGGTGSGERGSSWNQANTKLYASRRASAAYINSVRASETGGRLVRTAS